MTRNFTQQTKFMKRMLVFNGRADSQNIQVEQEPKEKDIRKLIVAAAERLFRQIGYQKTTVIDIAHELHMSPTNIYRFFAAKSESTRLSAWTSLRHVSSTPLASGSAIRA